MIAITSGSIVSSPPAAWTPDAGNRPDGTVLCSFAASIPPMRIKHTNMIVASAREARKEAIVTLERDSSGPDPLQTIIAHRQNSLEWQQQERKAHICHCAPEPYSSVVFQAIFSHEAQPIDMPSKLAKISSTER